MIDNFWILVSQLASVLVYIGIAFWLYRLLTAQKDATIQAKDATIENLQTRLQEIQSKVPDILAEQLEERLKVAKTEIERLKDEKGGSSVKIGSLRERQEITAKILANLLLTINVFQFLSKPVNETYRDFVVDVCGSVDEAVKTILVSKSITDLAAKHEKSINKTDNIGPILSDSKAKEILVTGRISHQANYAVLKDNKIWIEDSSLQEFTRMHQKIRKELNLEL